MLQLSFSMHGMTKTCRGCGREFAAGETFCPDDGSRLSSISQMNDLNGVDPLIGTTLDGRYRILRAIGEGGMGVVYEAEHVLIEKRVAIKVLRESFTRRPDVVERFRQEAKSASRIGHPNIVDVSDFGETPARSSYIVMEMLHGEDLADVLSRECALAPARATMIVYQVGKALGAAHRKNIIHRDLKPENIYLIEREGQQDFVKVVDFGVAKMSDIETLGGRKLTRTGMIFGTPEYMSPEHAGGKSLDHRVDIYALGIILYELLTGRVPFEGDNFMEVLSKHGHDTVPDLRSVNPGTRVSPELSRVVARALEKDPGRRYQTMDDMMNDLRSVPELPYLGPAESRASHVPPEWARSAPPPPPAALQTSTAPVESKARVSTARFRLPDRRWVVSASVLAASAIVVALVWPRAETVEAPRVTELPKPVAASALTAAQPPSAAIVETAKARAPVATGAIEQVEVRLRTQPNGASVNVDGMGEVCRATPCAFLVPRDQDITLHAKAGTLSAVRTLSFAEPSDVELRLSRPTPAGGTAKAKVAPQPTQTARSELKIPAAFR